MENIRNYCYYIIIFGLILLLEACSNAGSRTTNGPTSITYILANGTVLTIPVNQLNVNIGSSTATSISAVGGTPGINILLSSTEVNELNTSHNSESNISISFNPESLVSGTISTSTIHIAASNSTTPGTYQTQIHASYMYNGQQYNQIIGTLSILVESNTLPSAGDLTLTPESSSLANGTHTNLTLTLNNSSNVNNLMVNITSSNPLIASVNESSCTLSSISNTCNITVTGSESEAGNVQIIAQAANYESANANINVYLINVWTWMNGESNENSIIVNYGTKGIESQSNIIGSRALAITFTDNQNNLWIFGGTDEFGNHYNDLWSYSVNSNQWTWISGESTTNNSGNYGPKGASRTLYLPAARGSSSGLTDVNGNFWVFGGQGQSNNTYNDLWKYSPTNNQWAWISGESSNNAFGVYGIQSIESTSNVPGARYGQVGWADHSGNLWIFGGLGYDSTNTFGVMNDLWRYNINTNQWTWMKGESIIYGSPNYGTKGVESSTNTPGSRLYSISFTDESGNLWLFGGINQYSDSYNDLWKYDVSTNQWVWISGRNTPNNSGNSGGKGTASTSYVPSARYGSIGWADKSNNLWIFGGVDYNNTVTGDLWKYHIATNEWTWVGGTLFASEGGICGTQGIASFSNIPGSRYAANGWTDNSGNLWLFGGLSYDCQQPPNANKTSNDLWRYQLY